MEFTCKLTEAEFLEFKKMTRSRWDWPVQLLANGIWLYMICGLGYIVLHSPHPRFGRTAIAFLIFLGGYLMYLWDIKRNRLEPLRKLNALADRFILTNEGVETHALNGKMRLVPWSDINDWKEGRLVIVLCIPKRFLIFPATKLSDIDRRPVRQFLQTQVQRALAVSQ